MAIRVGWLPTGTQSAEDTRFATGALWTPTGLTIPRIGAVPAVAGSTAFALTSTGSLSCSVGAGQALMRPDAVSTQGPYPVTVDATGGGLPTVSFAAGGSLARTDVIYLQVQDTAEDGSGFTRGQIAVQQGANGGGVPAVPSGALALWQVPVPASASSISFATATYVAGVTVALGGVFPSSSSGLPGLAHPGQTRARLDRAGTALPGPLEVYDGTTWNPAVPASMPRGLAAAPLASTASGTTTSGTAETFDTILGFYAVSLTSGRRYRVQIEGMMGQTTVAGDVYTLQIRDSQSASNPTTASPMVASQEWSSQTSGGASHSPAVISGNFMCTVTGTHTFGFSATRIVGSGVFLPAAAPTVGRSLTVEDIGNV